MNAWMVRIALLAAPALFAASAFAQEPAAPPPVSPSAEAPADSGVVHSLSQDQIDRILSDAAAKRGSIEDEPALPHRQVHGEMGFMVGTGGMAAGYGTIEVPLGNEGFAAVSFETGTYGNPRGHRHWRR